MTARVLAGIRSSLSLHAFFVNLNNNNKSVVVVTTAAYPVSTKCNGPILDKIRPQSWWVLCGHLILNSSQSGETVPAEKGSHQLTLGRSYMREVHRCDAPFAFKSTGP
jgi:hypothetical protein